MRSQRNDAGSTKAKPFPKLQRGKDSNNIYLMYTKSEGTVVSVGSDCRTLGEACVGLNRGLLEDYSGEITLNND